VGAAAFGESGEIIGVSEDGFWWLADAPNLPEGEVWVSAEWVAVTGGENVPVVAAPPLEPTLTDIPWEWVSTTDPAQGTVAVNDPSRYVILFNDDGTVAIQADCNNVGASYTTDGSNISITTGPSTMAACPSDSLDSQFLAQLTSAAIYFIEGGNLYLDLPADSGTMRFVPQGTPPPEADAPAGEGDGLTFYLVSYGPQGAENPLIEGTQITASFADDVVTGNSGCNNYSGALTPVDDHFTVGPILTTRQFCAEPAGVMDQEQAYLAALEATGGYQWEQTRRNDGTLVPEGQLFYNLPDSTVGVMNFTTSP
jgi:heat shock protein HslJ